MSDNTSLHKHTDWIFSLNQISMLCGKNVLLKYKIALNC